MRICHIYTENELALCKIHLFNFVEPDMAEADIRKPYTGSVLSCLYQAVLPKLFSQAVIDSSIIVEFEKSLSEMLEHDYHKKNVNGYEEKARDTASKICNLIVVIVIESYYYGEYKRSVLEFSKGFIDASKDDYVNYENGRIATTEESFSDVLEKIRTTKADEDRFEIYAQGIPQGIIETETESFLNAWSSFSKKLLNSKKPSTGNHIIPWHFFYSRQVLSVCAIVAFVVICIFAYPYIRNVNFQTNESEETETVVPNKEHPVPESTMFVMSPLGEISFTDNNYDTFSYKVCESVEECHTIDWNKPDGRIPGNQRLYVKKSCWIAISGYSEETEQEKAQYLEVNFCDILTYLFRHQEFDILQKMTSPNSVYSKDQEFSDGCYLEDYYRSISVREDFGENGKYKVTGYEYAPCQNKGLFDLRNKDYPKLKEISIDQK